MTTGPAIRILTGVLALVLTVIGVTLVVGGGDEGGDSEESSGQTTATAGSDGDRTQADDFG